MVSFPLSHLSLSSSTEPLTPPALHFVTPFRKVKLWTLVITTVVSLAIGLLPMIDNFAHIGGFVTGILSSMLVRCFYRCYHTRPCVFPGRGALLCFLFFFSVFCVPNLLYLIVLGHTETYNPAVISKTEKSASLHDIDANCTRPGLATHLLWRAVFSLV